MARRKSPPSYKKSKRRRNRSDADYIQSARNLSALVPSVRPLAKRKRLSSIEKARITRKERILKGVPDIFPVTRQQAKLLGNQQFATGVQGIQLRGVPKDARIDFKGKDITVQYGGRTYLYWHLSRATVRSKRGMRDAGRRAFEQQFPIELVSELAEEAFKRGNVVQINLWAHAGIVGDPHHTLSEFVQWVNQKWSAGRYIRTSIYGGNSDPGKWVNGIAILLEDAAYTARRKKLIEENRHVIEEMEAKGRAHRRKEKRRLAKKGLGMDLLPLPKKKRTAAKKAKRNAPVKRKTSQKAKKAIPTRKAKTPNRKAKTKPTIRKVRRKVKPTPKPKRRKRK